MDDLITSIQICINFYNDLCYVHYRDIVIMSSNNCEKTCHIYV